MLPDDIIDFWFSDRVRDCWWIKDTNFDAEIRDRFEPVFRRAVAGELADWRETASGCLAEIIVLDQFPRNMYRDTPASFENDHLARLLCRQAVDRSLDQQLEPELRCFLYMPLMHSEEKEDHELAVQLFSSDPDLAYNLEFELKHKAIIDRFGRYPHRNEILGRESTEEERAFLEQPGSSF